MKRLGATSLIAVLQFAACSSNPQTGTDGGADLATAPDLGSSSDLAGGDASVGPALKRASRSSAIAISDDDAYVAAVSPDDDLVYVINTATNKATPVALPAGSEPRSIAFAPDGSFWVANRAAGTIVQITNVTGSQPTAGSPIAVGAEPTGIAVTPHGSRVLVANYSDGTISIVPTAGGSASTVAVGANPRALTITNTGVSDDNETAYVTLMFGQPISGQPAEGNDTGKQGTIIPVAIGSGTAGTAITLAPIADTTFKVANKANQQITVGAYPNQLQSIVLSEGKLYAPSTAASPAGPTNFAGNVHPFVSVYDTAQNKELSFGMSGTNANTACGTSVAANTVGYEAGTIDLAIQTRDLNGATTPPPVLFPTIPVDMDFVPGTDIGYVLSEASDEIVRVSWDYAGNTVCAGSNVAKAINLQASAGDIKVPIGIVITNSGLKAYVNSWAGREVELVDFSSQTVTTRIGLTPQPTTDPQKTIQRGKKVFWTSTGRWSKNGWGSCGACHPDGLSDNVTFVFGTGPRQTLPLDSDYAKIAGVPDPTDQRILNWTAINDEIHDFENNTRGISGGLGAVVSTTAGTDTQVDLNASKDFQLLGSVKQLALDGTTVRPLIGGTTGTVNTAVASAWDAIDLYVQSLRSMHHASNLSQASVTHGAALFQTAGCANCHAGPKWTTSRRPYAPTEGAGTGASACALQTTNLAKKSVPVSGNSPQNIDVFQLELERAPIGKSCAVATDCGTAPGYACTNGYCTVAAQRLACAIRSVGTYGSGPQGLSFEVRSDTNAAGTPLVAEGVTGFNIPSLLSLGATAPYLHDGGAPTLVDLFTNVAYTNHTTAGNPNFAPSASDAQDLASFLLSIDATTTVQTIDTNFDLCNGSFTANAAAVCTNP